MQLYLMFFSPWKKQVKNKSQYNASIQSVLNPNIKKLALQQIAAVKCMNETSSAKINYCLIMPMHFPSGCGDSS